MKKQAISLMLSLVLVLLAVVAAAVLPSAAVESIAMEPLHGQQFQPDGVTFGRVSFIVPSNTKGLTKDAWDNNIDHNTDLILMTYEKDGVVYENKTVREIKEHLGTKALMRTCYTYDDRTDGTIQLNLVFHMDDQNTLKPANFLSVTVKAGFVWCAGSPAGIDKELPELTLDRDVSFMTKGEEGITAVKVGNMGSSGTSLYVRFDRKDTESLKAISTVNLCPSAIPGKTLGDLVTINGVTVTELVKQNQVARFNFYGDALIFHVDDDAYRNAMLNEHYEVVILPGFRWMNWTQDDWGNWAGSHANDYTPVDGTLVTRPLTFYFDENANVCVKTDGITVEPGYKDTYVVGDRIDMTTLLIRVNYASGRSEVTPILESMVTYDFSKAGEAIVSINVKGMTAAYTVMVEALSETEAPTEAATQAPAVEETEAPTEAITEAPTVEEATEAPVTQAPASGDTDPAPESKGCGGMLSVGSALMLSLIGSAVFMKRKEN